MVETQRDGAEQPECPCDEREHDGEHGDATEGWIGRRW
jgi:hypothetical protein